MIRRQGQVSTLLSNKMVSKYIVFLRTSLLKLIDTLYTKVTKPLLLGRRLSGTKWDRPKPGNRDKVEDILLASVNLDQSASGKSLHQPFKYTLPSPSPTTDSTRHHHKWSFHPSRKIDYQVHDEIYGFPLESVRKRQSQPIKMY